jgi:cell division initiation protein
VAGYLSDLAEQIEYADADRAELRAELERFRNSTPDEDQRAHITAHAVGLLSQAQQIADNLVAEAEQYAKDLVESARHQQRDVLQQAHDSVETAVKRLPVSDAQAAELEYVRTFTQVAHVQLRSVLDALAEQVERLGHLPQPPRDQSPLDQSPRGQTPLDQSVDGDVQWWTDLSSDGARPAHDSLSPGGHRRQI